jgi:hypothetical protein
MNCAAIRSLCRKTLLANVLARAVPALQLNAHSIRMDLSPSIADEVIE